MVDPVPMAPSHLAGTELAFLRPYIIAEIGVNHEGDLERARRMIGQVARAGGHAAKFQTYKAGKIATKEHSPYYWDLESEPSTSQYDLFLKYDSFGEEEYRSLAQTCADEGIDFVSTPFDLDSIELLDPLVPFFKIASADLTNIPLLRRVASKKKPVVLSTGASTPIEIANAIQTLRDADVAQLTLLHCVLNYPTPKEHAQMAQLDRLIDDFGSLYSVGYSDHVAPEADGTMPCLELAILRGAVVLEKHFTDDKTSPGNDHYHAMDEHDLAAFTKKVSTYRQLYGSRQRNLDWEARARENARRRIVSARTIEPGEVLMEADLIALRANRGIEISSWDDVVGKSTSRRIEAGEPLRWEDLVG